MKDKADDIILPDTYGSELYQPENIECITGDPSRPESVTVYFKKGNLFGRITQYHHDSNKGRELVSQSPHHKLVNELLKDIFGKTIYSDETLHEYVGDCAIHKSRSKFIPVSDLNATQMIEISKSIIRFPDLKPTSSIILSLIEKHFSEDKSDKEIAKTIHDDLKNNYKDEDQNTLELLTDLVKEYNEEEAFKIAKLMINDSYQKDQVSIQVMLSYYRSLLNLEKNSEVGNDDLSALSEVPIPNRPFNLVELRAQLKGMTIDPPSTQNKNLRTRRK